MPIVSKNRGFTLAELLTCLGILGVIATFTIPKVLHAQQDSKYKAMAKEAAGTLSHVMQVYQLSGLLKYNTKPKDLTPYFNYVSLDTASNVDDHYTAATVTCSANNPCMRLHNGGVLVAKGQLCNNFGGTASTNNIEFLFDPDGTVTDGTTNGPGKAVQFEVYYDGGIRTRATAKLNTICSLGAIGTDTGADPPWFSW